jgi:uncharacterized membrane protein YdbT with pleckstrin-like domain
MSYIQKTLLANEKILYQTTVHKFIYISAVGWLFFAILLFIYSFELHENTYMRMARISSYILFAMTAYDFLLSFIKIHFSEFALTNKRVLVKTGFIRRQSLETFLQKVEGIQVDQSILGRVFNFGTITIIGTGGSRDRFAKIDDPMTFRRRVQQQIQHVFANMKASQHE